MRRIIVSRTDNGAVLVVQTRGQRRPEEIRVYDFDADGGKRAFGERLEAHVAGTAEALSQGPRKRLILEPAVNGTVVRTDQGKVLVFTDPAELRDWLRWELEL